MVTIPIVPQKTKLVKLFQVFFCSSIFIKNHPCLAFIRGFFLFITYNFPRLLTNLLFKSLFFKDFKELTTFINELSILIAWQRPTLPYLKAKYHRR